MPSFERSIVVNAAPGKVFEFVADITHHADWSSHGLEVTALGQGGPSAGARYNTVGKQLGTHQAEVTITEFTPPSRVAYEAKGDVGETRHWFEVSPNDGMTELKKGFEPLKTGFALTLAKPFMRLIVPRGLDADLRKIKEKLEAAP